MVRIIQCVSSDKDVTNKSDVKSHDDVASDHTDDVTLLSEENNFALTSA